MAIPGPLVDWGLSDFFSFPIRQKPLLTQVRYMSLRDTLIGFGHGVLGAGEKYCPLHRSNKVIVIIYKKW